LIPLGFQLDVAPHNAELSGIFSSVTASEAWFVMLEKISDSNVCSRRLRREQTWSNAQLGIRAAAGGANDYYYTFRLNKIVFNIKSIIYIKILQKYSFYL